MISNYVFVSLRLVTWRRIWGRFIYVRLFVSRHNKIKARETQNFLSYHKSIQDLLCQVQKLLKEESNEVKKFILPIWRWLANFTLRQICFSRKLLVHTAQETELRVQRLYGLGDEENISWCCREWNFNRQPCSHPLYTLNYSNSSARAEGLKVHCELK